MGNHTTTAGFGLSLAGLVALTACSGPDPDPAAIARSLRSAGPATAHAATTIVPAVAPLPAQPPQAPPAAPLGEGSRAAQAAPERPQVALGAFAAGALGDAAAVLEALAPDEPAVATQPDRDAIERMLQGSADYAIVVGKLSARDQRAGLQQTRLGVELFALAVRPDAPLRSLSTAQVRKVLTGEVRTWPELGHDGGAITVLVPADEQRAHRAAKALVPGDAFAASCVAVADDELPFRLHAPGTIAVVRVATEPLQRTRLVAIDWSVPGIEAFTYGTYPCGHALTLVTNGTPARGALAFLRRARSIDGRALLARTLLLPR